MLACRHERAAPRPQTRDAHSAEADEHVGPWHSSSVNQRVPRTLAEAYRPCVVKLPFTLAHSFRTTVSPLGGAPAAVAVVRRALRVGGDGQPAKLPPVRVAVTAPDLDSLRMNAPPYSVPVILPVAVDRSISTWPSVASIVAPNGTLVALVIGV